jgi:hypothetical protein
MTTKAENQYILWDGASFIIDEDTVRRHDTPAFSEGDVLDFMNYCDSDVLYVYELVPVRKYERVSGVKVTEIKETKR